VHNIPWQGIIISYAQLHHLILSLTWKKICFLNTFTTMKNTIILTAGLLIAGACGTATQQTQENQEPETSAMQITQTEYGTTEDGTPVDLFTLVNENGVEMKVTNYGGIITELKVPDKNGEPGDVVLGFDNLEDYIESNPFFGALVGRYGNRIAEGKFTLDGQEYTLVQNNGPNHLHGGTKGFDKKVWKAEPAETEEGPQLKLSYLSEHMEEGYPGNLDVEVTYTLTNDDAVRIDYKATTDQKTIVNLTNHSYFNLSNEPGSKILDHEVMLNAEQFVPVDETLIPTGELQDVEGTPMDFTEPTAIGTRIDTDHEQTQFGKGYDHTWVINGTPGELRLGATVYEPNSGRFMEMLTTEPGVQFYTGNFLDGKHTGKGETVYGHRTGFCLETQHYPDSPNQPNFPSVELNPGETYETTTVYKFSVQP